MKKRIALLSAALMFFTVSVNASVYIKYYNKDSKTYKFEVKIGGSTRTVEFGSSRTAAVTIQGGGDSAEIKTECGWVKIDTNSKIEIKDGCIKIQ